MCAFLLLKADDLSQPFFSAFKFARLTRADFRSKRQASFQKPCQRKSRTRYVIALASNSDFKIAAPTQSRSHRRRRRIPGIQSVDRFRHDKTARQRQIEATDYQVDQLVYELYGLNEEEIKIVEGGE